MKRKFWSNHKKNIVQKIYQKCSFLFIDAVMLIKTYILTIQMPRTAVSKLNSIKNFPNYLKLVRNFPRDLIVRGKRKLSLETSSHQNKNKRIENLAFMNLSVSMDFNLV